MKVGEEGSNQSIRHPDGSRCERGRCNWTYLMDMSLDGWPTSSTRFLYRLQGYPMTTLDASQERELSIHVYTSGPLCLSRLVE